MITANDVASISHEGLEREDELEARQVVTGGEREVAGERPPGAGYSAVKLVSEWVMAFVLLVITAPLVLLLAVAVKMSSPGPAFYAQTRLGRFGRKYRMFKLRTMVHNAETGTGPVWATKNDVRVTRVGKFLRGTHLDELPQLWNVLRGERGLIGPRPERPEIAARIERKVPEFRNRLQVRPGVTGLAQMLLPADDPDDVNLDGLRKKLAHDIYYVRQLSLLLDLRIALSTPCYFLAAAIHAMQRGFVRAYGAEVEKQLDAAGGDLNECGRAA